MNFEINVIQEQKVGYKIVCWDSTLYVWHPKMLYKCFYL